MEREKGEMRVNGEIKGGMRGDGERKGGDAG